MLEPGPGIVIWSKLGGGSGGTRQGSDLACDSLAEQEAWDPGVLASALPSWPPPAAPSMWILQFLLQPAL